MRTPAALATAALTALAMGLPAGAARAAEDCPCGLDPDVYAKIGSLVDAQLDIQSRLAPLQGRAFHKSPEEIEALKLFADHEAILRKSCPAMHRKVRSFGVAIRQVGITPGRSVRGDVTDPGGTLLAAARRRLNDANPPPKPKPSELGPECQDPRYWKGELASLPPSEWAARTRCKDQLVELGEERRKKHQQGLMTRVRESSLDDVQKLIDPHGKATEQRRVSAAALKAFAGDDAASYFKALDGMKNQLSRTEKVSLVAQIMSAGAELMYDDELKATSTELWRLAGGGMPDVSTDGVFRAYREFVTRGRQANRATRTICRQFAAFGARTAQALGLEGILVTGNVAGNLHTRVLLREKDGGNQAYVTNYGRWAEVAGKEGGALLDAGQMGLGEGAVVYMLSRADSKSDKEPAVAMVAGEAAKVYLEALGNDVRKIEPLARTTASVRMAEARLGKTPVTLFIGEDGQGTGYAGAAARREWQVGDAGNSGAAGAVLAYRPTGEGTGSFADLHVQAEQRLKAGLLETKVRGIPLRAEAEALGLAMVDLHAHFLDGETTLGAGVPLVGANLAVRADAADPGTGVSASLRGEIRPRVGTSDNTSMSLGVFNDATVLTAGASLRRGPHQAAAEATLVLDAFGEKALGQLGYGYKDFAAQLEAGGRLDGDDATVRDGSLRHAGIQAAQGLALGDAVDLTVFLGGSLPLEGDERVLRFSTGLGGQF